MRKITDNATAAFETGRKFTSNNTTVTVEGDVRKLFLFGNLIAKYVPYDPAKGNATESGLFITDAGYNTPTTRERLNGLRGVKVNTVKGQLFLNGEKWDGQMKKVN